MMACNAAIGNHTHCYDFHEYILKYPLVISVIIFILYVG